MIHTGVGAITESDVLLASASEAIIVGFNVRPERSATQLAEQEKVDIRLHTIIYELTDEIKKAMTGMLEPVFKEVYRGRAEVQADVPDLQGRHHRRAASCRTVSLRETAASACCATTSSYTRAASIRLKRFKDDVSEVRTGMECGIGLDNYNDVKPGDVIEAFVTERVATEGFV